MSADNNNFLNFVKIIAGLPGTRCSYSRRNVSTMYVHRCAYNSCKFVTRFNVFTCPCQHVNHCSLSATHARIFSYLSKYVSTTMEIGTFFDKQRQVHRTLPHEGKKDSPSSLGIWTPIIPSNTRLSVSIVKISSIHSAILRLPQRIVV